MPLPWNSNNKDLSLLFAKGTGEHKSKLTADPKIMILLLSGWHSGSLLIYAGHADCTRRQGVGLSLWKRIKALLSLTCSYQNACWLLDYTVNTWTYL